jgi:hypothetical protein
VPPEPTGVNIPVEPTEATAVLLLLHEPPGVASLSVIAEPWHAVAGPAIAAGTAITVTTYPAEQVVILEVYDIKAVPEETPVT